MKKSAIIIGLTYCLLNPISAAHACQSSCACQKDSQLNKSEKSGTDEKEQVRSSEARFQLRSDLRTKANEKQSFGRHGQTSMTRGVALKDYRIQEGKK